MFKTLATAVLATCIVSCSMVGTREASIPKHIAGLTVSSKFSGWGLNWCSKGEPVKNLYSRPEWNCPTIGGEIHVVRVKYGQSLADGKAVPTFDVLVPIAVDGTYEHAVTLSIEPAPADLAADTGVKYWARSFAFINSQCPGEKAGHWSSRCLSRLLEGLGNEP